jgi:hypothetical protein
MEGISAVASGETAVLVVEHVSDELKKLLRQRLAAFCFGAVEVELDSDYYSFEATITELLTRFDSKPKATKIGMVGELVVHVLMPSSHPSLSSSAIYFNKEERSIKKGFDLTFHEGTKAIWYGEVKSGHVKDNESADDKSSSLLKTAAADVAGKLSQDAQRSRWDAAIYDAGLTLESSQAKTVKALLRSDARVIATGTQIKKNVVLAATVVHSVGHCRVSVEATAVVAEEIVNSKRFDATRILVIQQEELETIMSYLRSEVAADA